MVEGMVTTYFKPPSLSIGDLQNISAAIDLSC